MDGDATQRKRDEFHRKIRGLEMREGFAYDDGKGFVTRPYWPLEPGNKMKAHLWRWSDVRPVVLECGDLVGLGHGAKRYDRRVLALTNPGSDGDFTTTGPLFGDIQLIRPGERAPCHRHTPCATRFILEGSGGWTTVAGQRVRVKPGDILYTGQFPWHDHGNDGSDDFIFLDVLDIPLLFFTGASAWEFDYERVTGSKETVNQPAKDADPGRPSDADLAFLPWPDARHRLEKIGAPSACDGARFEFKDSDGGPVGPTVSVHAQRIRPGEKTLAHRHTGSSVFICAEGTGKVRVGDEIFEVSPRDIFVIPSWQWHSFESERGFFLQSISDLSLIRKMRLYREQRRDADGEISDSGWTEQAEPFDK